MRFKFFILAFLLLSSCERKVSVVEYKLQDLFSKTYMDSLERDSVKSSFKFNLCQTTKLDWDSVLFIKPYIDKSLVQSLPIANYSAISTMVDAQALNEGTCTLAFVGGGRYVGYGVFSRNPIDLTTINTGKEQQLVWVTRKGCINLRLNKVSTNAGKFYNIGFKRYY